jgi:hypothetical protein
LVLNSHPLRFYFCFPRRAPVIMTVILKYARPDHRTRSIDDETMIALAPTTRELLMYEPSSDQVRMCVCVCVCVCGSEDYFAFKCVKFFMLNIHVFESTFVFSMHGPLCLVFP